MEDKYVQMRPVILELRRKVVDAKGSSVEGLTPLPEKKDASKAPRKNVKTQEKSE